MSRLYIDKPPKDFKLEHRYNVVIGKNDYYMQLAEGVYVAIKKKPQFLHRLFLRAFFGFKNCTVVKDEDKKGEE